MKTYRSIALVLTLVIVSSVAAFAGAPAPTTEKPVPVQEVTPPPPPPPPPPKPVVRPLVISKYNTWGIGLGGNPIIGVVEKDQYGYPHSEYTGPFYGIDWVLGFGMTWYSGSPTADQLSATEDSIRAANPGVANGDVPSLVRRSWATPSAMSVSGPLC